MGVFSEFLSGFRDTYGKTSRSLNALGDVFTGSSMKGRTIRNAEERDRRETQKLYRQVKAANFRRR